MQPLSLLAILTINLHLLAAAVTEATSTPAMDAVDAKCLTQKMLISCSAAKLPGVIACGGPLGNHVALATEVLLDWDHNASLPGGNAQMSAASLSLELSRPSNDLSLVLLDLGGTELCTGKKSGAQLRISFITTYPGPRLSLKGLRLDTVSSLSLEGNVVLNADLLTGLPHLERLAAYKNNVSLSSQQLARYSVTGAPSLTSLYIVGSIHSVAYATPLLKSLVSLQSARISQSNMLLLKSGSFVSLPALRYLYLSDNNIHDLAVGSLSHLSSLEHLFLNANGIRRLANYAFADLTSLRRLNLASNRLSEVQPNAFHGLARLQHLDLSENQLTQLPETLFAQPHGLQTLNLQRNRGLRLEDVNDTFCPLEGLTTVWTDVPVDCERFGAARLVQLVNSGGATALRRKKYDCDISQVEAGQRHCHNWLGRLALRQRQTAAELPAVATGGGGGEGGGGGPPRSQLHVVLLVIFGVICLVHVLTTAVTIYACRHMRRRRQLRVAGAMAARRKSPSVSSPEEERSLDASPGLATRFAPTSGNGGAAAKAKTSDRDRDGAGNRLNVRDKSYDFNEDEHHA